ncbi:MAG TPA: DUF2520 domain-containing protein [Bacteroidales bacterium]|nr:DUF2520 domain-containing protein [Bacteroidales bacterium]
MDPRQSFVIIGAGNVASHLAGALASAAYRPLQVVGRSTSAAKELADTLDTTYTVSLNEINTQADFYVVAVNDDAIPKVLSGLKINDKLVFHTSGSTGISVFGNKFTRCGVFYPLQTFSKNRVLDFHEVPLFIESSGPEAYEAMTEIAKNISRYVRPVDSALLEKIHIAAVFACNFTNHMYVIAEDLVNEIQVPFEILLPLIRETFLKLGSGPPASLQTGPAVRGDVKIIEKHRKSLENHPEYQKIYTFVSQNILELHKKNTGNE